MLKPLGDHVILRAFTQEEKTESGIFLPQTADKERPEQGEVVAIGPGRMMDNGQRSTIDVEVGNKVMFKKYSPDQVTVDGEEYLVIRADDIVAVID